MVWNTFQKMLRDFENSLSIENTLARLSRALNGPLLLTGGLAFRWHAAQNGIAVDNGAISDIDIVVPGLSDLSPALAKDFLIIHFHPRRSRGRILIQLADELQRLRVDVFTPASPLLITRTQAAEVGGVHYRVIGKEDLAAKILTVLAGVTAGEHVDPKHYDKFRTLSRLVDPVIMREIWPAYRQRDHRHSFEVVAESVHERIEQDPSVLRSDVYDQSVDAVCRWCENDDSYPISPRAKIFAVLGYV